MLIDLTPASLPSRAASALIQRVRGRLCGLLCACRADREELQEPLGKIIDLFIVNHGQINYIYWFTSE